MLRKGRPGTKAWQPPPDPLPPVPQLTARHGRAFNPDCPLGRAKMARRFLRGFAPVGPWGHLTDMGTWGHGDMATATPQHECRPVLSLIPSPSPQGRRALRGRLAPTFTLSPKTSVERVQRPDQAGVWREATTPQDRSLQGGATSPQGAGLSSDTKISQICHLALVH